VDDRVLRYVDEVIANDQINDALQHVRDILTETRRDDILQIFNQIMEGKIFVQPIDFSAHVTSTILGYFPKQIVCVKMILNSSVFNLRVFEFTIQYRILQNNVLFGLCMIKVIIGC
jgi:hypothetical protein